MKKYILKKSRLILILALCAAALLCAASPAAALAAEDGAGAVFGTAPALSASADPIALDLAARGYPATVSASRNAALPLSGRAVCLATGTDFPDALAGSVLAAKVGAPVLLVAPGDTIADRVRAYIAERSPEVVYVFGGQAAVSDETVAACLPEEDE